MPYASEEPPTCPEDGTCPAAEEALEPSPLEDLPPAAGPPSSPPLLPPPRPSRPPQSVPEPATSVPDVSDETPTLPDPWASIGESPDLLDLMLLDPEAVSDVFSLLLDDLILDSVPPADLSNDLPFLERLCRETDLPDFRCRQLYGE